MPGRYYPVRTEEAECQDCYKCLRNCPVKAIKVEYGRASIVPDLCIACGSCVAACPSKAKHVRDDTGLARDLLADPRRPVYVSLAPSWVSEFPGMPAGNMVAALRRLGFSGVGETALGAQEVSAATARLLRENGAALHLSTACPAAVEFVNRYLPEVSHRLSPLSSPVLAHCGLLRRSFGQDIAVVFIGPCVAKKSEADRHPELLQAALNYTDLRRMLAEADISPLSLTPGPEDAFVPRSAQEGALYPVEGGMNDTVRIFEGMDDVRFVTLAGMRAIERSLRGLDPAGLPHPVFVELLACEGGCVRGPCVSDARPLLAQQLDVLERVGLPLNRAKAPTAAVNIAEDRTDMPIETPPCSEEQLREALLMLGKQQPEDELNCGGCGHDSCRDLAAALLAGMAEPSMCVHFLRKRALRKANALLRSIPAGVVIVDKNLRVIECNQDFAGLFGEDIIRAYRANPGLEGTSLKGVVPFVDLFETALADNTDSQGLTLRLGEKFLSATIFVIEPGQVVGGVIFDVTGTEQSRDRIAHRAREIIRKNLEAVQEIAWRLGENMADTEILLRSLSEEFSVNARGEGNGAPPGRP